MTDSQVVPAENMLPNKLVLIPLNGKPLFPGILTPFMTSANEDMAAIKQATDTDNLLGMIMTHETDEENHTQFHTIGTVARIMKKINLPDGGVNIFISTIKRFKIQKILKEDAPVVAAVSYLEEIEGDPMEMKALTRALLGEMKELSENNPLFSEEMRLNMVNIDHPGKIADFIASILNINREEQQEILETLDVINRMEKVLVHIKKEQELMRIQKTVQKRINEKIEKSQKEYFLKEELKQIKKELGMPTDAKTSEHQKFKEKLKKLNISADVKSAIEEELEKFALMDPHSSEFVVSRNYLDTIFSLPWEEPQPENIKLDKAKRILDQDHYGLEDVKTRVLEFLSVRILKKDNKGSILCLVGPPGVGKTSVGKSIARAMNKKFFRFSVGGMRDEAEIKGHRRTYVGAMPGKIIQGLKSVKTAAPVFMIDEIDKLGASYQGDPSSALLEVLDPEQNVAFRDHYLDLPFDISHIFFIATANTLDTIPRPLLDRMEIIRLAGYIEKEKIAIAKKYIIPKSLDKHGLDKKKVKYTTKALSGIANGWARDAGMRNFEKAIDKIHRKIAHKIVSEELDDIFNIDDSGLSDYLDQPFFREDELKKITAPGMAIGLAWTNFGGDTLVIEAVQNEGKESFRLTGQMGDVMQESAKIAYSYVRHIAPAYNIDNSFFEKNTIHLHIPAGATPKDGPSAGITMASCLLSLARNKKIKANIAMTGELSLVGQVLPIGGLKEKVIAARRNKIKKIIIPAANERDLKEIPDHVKKGIDFFPVQKMTEVLDLIF